MKRMIWNGEELVEVDDGREERRPFDLASVCPPDSDCLRSRLEAQGRFVPGTNEQGAAVTQFEQLVLLADARRLF